MPGSIDFGVLGTTVDGDGARYERYRDLRSGPYFGKLQLNRETKGWVMDLGADNIGRRDQRFDGLFVRPGKFKGYALWDQIPMLMSQTTQTLFTEDLEGPQGVLTIQDPLQLQVQAVPGVIAPVFHSNAVVFTTDSRRYIGLGGFEYIATPELTIKSQVQYTDRQGMLPYGGSFGHSSLVEMPAPINHRLADVDAGAEYSRGAVMFRAGYNGSFFHNEDTTVDLRQSVPFDGCCGDPLERTQLAAAEQLVRFGQRHGVGQDAGTIARDRVRLDGAIEGRGRFADAPDDQLGEFDRFHWSGIASTARRARRPST